MNQHSRIKSTAATPPHLFFVVGPTTTGKSALSLQLAHQLNAHLLSADSRQIYQGLEITSGADIPSNFSYHKSPNSELAAYYEVSSGPKIFGTSVLQPLDEWSISQFRNYALRVIDACTQEHKNLIIVGGSGLYIESLLINDPKLAIPPNDKLRQELESFSIEQLHTRLHQLSHTHLDQMNNSDRQNPRRLIRAIEVLQYLSNHTLTLQPTSIENLTQTWIGLHIDKEELSERIQQRVVQRIQNGAIQEVELLLSNFPNQKLPSFTTTGVREIIAYITGQIDKSQLVEMWTLREFQYAKRQITWFKKRHQIEWFSILDTDLLNTVQKKLGFGV